MILEPPNEFLYLPLRHGLHSIWSVLSTPSEYLPLGHKEHVDENALENLPLSHILHDKPGLSLKPLYLPGIHLIQSLLLIDPKTLPCFPGMQLIQNRLCIVYIY